MRSVLFIRTIPVFLLAFCAACVNQDQVKPTSSGRSGEVIVVAPGAFWDSPAGEALDSIFTAPQPYLPQEEARFTLIRVLPENFSSILKIHRNVLLIASSTREFDADQIRQKGLNGMAVLLRDYYAKGQMLFVFRPQADPQELADFMSQKAESLARKIEEEEMERLALFYAKVRDQKVSETVESVLDIKLNVPKDYYLATQTKDFVWLRSETHNRSLNLILYRGKGPMNPSKLLEVRNRLGKEHIPGPIEGTYMQTEERVAPVTDSVRVQGKWITRHRGMWRLHNDFMGGPFAGYFYPLPQADEWLYAEGFVYAPGAEKRELLRNLMGLLQSMQLQ